MAPPFKNKVTATFQDIDPMDVRKIIAAIQKAGFEHEINVESVFVGTPLAAEDTQQFVFPNYLDPELDIWAHQPGCLLIPSSNFVEGGCWRTKTRSHSGFCSIG